MLSILLGIFSLLIPTLAHSRVEASYPSKGIRLLVGTSDALPRVLAQGLTTRLGQQVIVDNRGAELLAMEVAVKALPDGSSFLLVGNAISEF